jgi:hypothetical protein
MAWMWCAWALAASIAVPVAGVVTDAGGAPLSGAVPVTFSLHHADDASFWTETQTVVFADGAFATTLGQVTTLDSAVFHEAGLKLSISVSGGAPSAPAPLATAPYAAHAWSLGGLPATAYQRVSDLLPWSRLDPATLPAGLADGDADTTYSAGAGLALTGTSFAVGAGPGVTVAGSTVGVNAGPGLTISGDAVTVNAGGGLAVSGGVLGVSVGSGLTLAGTTLAVRTGAGLTTAGGTLAVVSSALQPDWTSIQNVPPNVAAGGTTYAAGSGLTLTGTTFSVNAGTLPGCGRTFRSCSDILVNGCSTGDGAYTLDVDGGGPLASLSAWCDMTTDGGGWTQVVQALTTDTAGELWRQPWTSNTPGRNQVAGSSYILGDAVRGLMYKSSAFKVELQKVSDSSRGHVLYPLDSRTMSFFHSAMSAYDVPAQVINADGTRSFWKLGLCFSGTYRSLSGATGLALLGATSVAPNATVNGECDWGDWRSQMLLRPAPATNAISTNFGESSFSSFASAGYHLRFSLR